MSQARTVLTTRCVRALLSGIAVLALSAALYTPSAVAVQGPWIAPASDLSAIGQNASDPEIAVAPDGAITAAWSRSDGAKSIVQTATRPPGGAFGAPVDLSAIGQHADSPQIGIAADGAATVTWYRFNGTHTIVQAATRPPGGTFGAPVDLSTIGQSAFSPQIAIAPDGATTVTWSRFNGTHTIIQAATRPPGGTFGAAVDLSATGQNASSPQLTVAADGTTTVTWFRSDGTKTIVQAATRPPGGTFGAPLDLSATGQDANYPRIAVAADGTTTVAWTRSNGTNTIVQAATRPPGGNFGAAVDLSTIGQDAGSPHVAVALDGTTTVAWGRSNGLNNIVQAATRPPGGNFGAAVDLSTIGQNAGSPQVVVAADATTTVAWGRSNGTHLIVQAATRPPGGSFGAPVDLSASGQGSSYPQIAVGTDGTTTATWYRYNPTHAIIQAAFTANPPARRAAPSITGTAALGATLSCDGGSWIGAATIATSWLRGASQIAAGPSYQVVAADQGTLIFCRALATNPFGSADSLSLPVSIPATLAAPAPAPPVDRAAPRLTVNTKTRLTRAQFLRGVSVRLSADEPTTVVAELLARAKSARISAVPFNLALGTRTVRGLRKAVTLRIKPNRSLVGRARTLTVRLRLTATDAAGNRRVTGKSIRVTG